MKLTDILEHDIVSKDRLKSKILWKLPKMKRTYPPFTKNAFKDGVFSLIDVERVKQIEDPAGGKVLKKSNSMKKKVAGKK